MAQSLGLRSLLANAPYKLGLKRGSKDKKHVGIVQQYLKRFGYLGDPARTAAASDLTATPTAKINAPVAKDGTFDDATVEAVRAYQLFHSLPITGEMDHPTIALMSRPRCGNEDPPAWSSGPARFVPRQPWSMNNLSYSFDSTCDHVPGLTPGQVRGAIVAALKLWSDKSSLKFHATTSSNANLKFGFWERDHGDGYPFDGQGGADKNTLAHAFFPSDGRLHFDLGDKWTVDLSADYDLVTVAAHEIGHALGLDHSPVQDSLMFSTYLFPRPYLSLDDENGIKYLYG